MKFYDIITDISDEMFRQQELKAAGKFEATCADNVLNYEAKYLILAEEVGEVAKAIQEMRHMGETKELKEELIQVCAVCIAWLESFDV